MSEPGPTRHGGPRPAVPASRRRLARRYARRLSPLAASQPSCGHRRRFQAAAARRRSGRRRALRKHNRTLVSVAACDSRQLKQYPERVAAVSLVLSYLSRWLCRLAVHGVWVPAVRPDPCCRPRRNALRPATAEPCTHPRTSANRRRQQGILATHTPFSPIHPAPLMPGPDRLVEGLTARGRLGCGCSNM